MTAHLPVLFAGLVLASGCASEVDDQEYMLLHDFPSDRLELILTNRGIAATKPSMVGRALRDIEPMIKGERVFGLVWPLFLDLDDLALDWTEEDQVLARGVKILEHGLFLDRESRLSLFQHVEIERLQAVMERVNEEIDAALLKDFESMQQSNANSETSGEDGGRYPRTQQRLLEVARAGWTWIAFHEGALSLRIPLDPTEITGLKEAFNVALEEEGPGGAVLRGVQRAVSDVQLSEGVLSVSFAPDAGGVIGLRIEDQVEGPWDPALFEAVRQRQRGRNLPFLSSADLRDRLVAD